MKPTFDIRLLFKRYFLIGLIVILPFFVAVKVLFFFTEYLDQVLEIKNGRFLFILPQAIHPDHIVGFHIPFLGAIFSVVLILVIGMLSKNYLGHKMIEWSDKTMSRLPVIRTVYNIVKQALQTYMNRDKAQFSRVVLIPYPSPATHTVAFVTGGAMKAINDKMKRNMLNVFVPTTPNPTSGFYLLVNESDAIDLDLSVEDAFKLVISGGMVTPQNEELAKDR